MNDIFSDDCLYNIIGHIKNCWTYDYPSGTSLENAIFEGIRPFYPNAKKLGSPSTIVDTAKDNDALDVKGRKVLGHLKRITAGANHNDNQFVEQIIPNFGKRIVKIPRSVITPVRRPQVDLKGYRGNPKETLNEAINEYQDFAFETTRKDGYKELYSIVVLYGIDKGCKSIFLTVNKFSTPKAVKFSVGIKKNGDPCSYDAHDLNGKLVFKLSSFNKGSSNFSKTFQTTHGILATWAVEAKSDFVYTRNYIEQTSAIKTV